MVLLTAYGLDLNPHLDLAGSLPAVVPGPGSMSMTFYAASPGITYTAQTSEDLQTWGTAGIMSAYGNPWDEPRCADSG